MDREDQFCTTIFICGSPPRLRPPAWSKPMHVESLGAMSWPILTKAQKNRWRMWAMDCRVTAQQQHWIADFNEWDAWLRNFLAWYDAAVTIITTEQELEYEQTKEG